MTASSSRPRKNWFVTLPRDTILFFAGLTGVIHETIFAAEDRAQLLLLFGAMMGLPAFLRADESRQQKNEEEGGA